MQLEKIRVAGVLLDDLALLVDDKGGGVDANVAEDLGRGAADIGIYSLWRRCAAAAN